MIIQIFGPPGAGKSSVLVYFAQEALQGHSLSIGHFNYKSAIGEFAPYDRVYSNLQIPGTYKLDVNALGVMDFQNCLIIIDEVMLDFDCRDYKNLSKHVIRFLATHRHYRADICICSQGYSDADRKFRTLTEKLLLCRKAGVFTRVALIAKDTDAIAGNIEEVFMKAPPLACTWIYRPRLYTSFDSYEKEPHKPNTLKLWDIPACSSPGLLRCAICANRWQCKTRVLFPAWLRLQLHKIPFVAASTNSGKKKLPFVLQTDYKCKSLMFSEWAVFAVCNIRGVYCVSDKYRR